MKKGLRKYFKTPIKGILDILLVMGITIAAVVFLGPIIIDKNYDAQAKEQKNISIFKYTCEKTGKIIKDYLKDDNGNIYGWISIKYHDNGNFKEVIENNERDRIIRNVHYNQGGEFLYWYEIHYDENGSETSIKKFDRYGILIEENNN